MTLKERLRRVLAGGRGAARPGREPSPKPETPYRRRYTQDRRFEDLVRRAREKKP